MSPAELPKGSVPGAFFRKVGKPEFAKATPAARYLSWLLLGVGDTSEQALAACGPRFGARDPYAGRSPPGARAIRARIAHRRTLRLPGWLFGAFRRYSAGRGQAAAAPLFAPHKGRVERPLPLCYPHLCLARSYRAHAGAFCGKPSSCANPGAGAACINAGTRPTVRGAAG